MTEAQQVVDREEQRLAVLVEDRGRLWLLPLAEEPDDRDLPNGLREVVSASASVEGGSFDALKDLVRKEPMMAVASFTSVGSEMGEGPVSLGRTREAEPARNAGIDEARFQIALATMRESSREGGAEPVARRPVSMGKGPDHGVQADDFPAPSSRGVDRGR
jgi:hypothetical protein